MTSLIKKRFILQTTNEHISVKIPADLFWYFIMVYKWELYDYCVFANQAEIFLLLQLNVLHSHLNDLGLRKMTQTQL